MLPGEESLRAAPGSTTTASWARLHRQVTLREVTSTARQVPRTELALALAVFRHTVEALFMGQRSVITPGTPGHWTVMLAPELHW